MQLGKPLWFVTTTYEMNEEVKNQIEIIHKRGYGPISTRYIQYNFGISLMNIDITQDKVLTFNSAFHDNKEIRCKITYIPECASPDDLIYDTSNLYRQSAPISSRNQQIDIRQVNI
jgi:hypothetical protein